MKKLILLLLPVLVLAGCVSEDDLIFHRVEDLSVSLGSTTVVNAVIMVENTSRQNVRVNDAVFSIFDSGKNEIGTLTVADELLLPKKSVTSLRVPLRIRLTDPIAGLGLLSNIEENAGRMTVTGNVRVKAGMLKKKFKVKNVPLSEFLSIFEGY
jgi:hypothetical protein